MVELHRPGTGSERGLAAGLFFCEPRLSAPCSFGRHSRRCAGIGSLPGKLDALIKTI